MFAVQNDTQPQTRNPRKAGALFGQDGGYDDDRDEKREEGHCRAVHVGRKPLPSSLPQSQADDHLQEEQAFAPCLPSGVPDD